MTAPMFEEVDPASDCLCPGCRLSRHASPRPHPGRARPAARAAVVVTAASAALGALPPAVAVAAPGQAPHREALPGDDGFATPQGPWAPLYGRPGGPEKTPADPIPATTRADIIKRAKTWVAAKVPYSMTSFWSDGYRQDCSGYVSMAWGLPNNEWTGSLGQFGVKITKAELEPGDILLFHNPDNPEKGSHVVIFGGWTDDKHTSYTAYEQTPPHARSQATPYAYWSNSDKYVPYRYKGLPQGAAGARAAGGAKTAVPYPGASSFRPGAANDHVTRLRARLVRKGYGRFYAHGPGPRWGEADRRAVEAFQRSQGWRGGAADGHPGPETWRRLFA
ncbi:peptidoglycan-binding protein [Streptomyces eurythermus]|uniref:peptidoglycan-binding protein n=1 Tax=Streptomyces eurythermus TaxID=42237 RepID=UPI00367FEB14